MSGIPCIGRMGGMAGDWYAELDYAAGEASVMERTAKGSRGPVATMPIGVFYEADDDHDEQMVPNDEQNKAVLAVVFSPEAWRVLRLVRDKIAARHPLEDGNPSYKYDTADFQLLRELDGVLECLGVPWTCRGCGGTGWSSEEETDQVWCDDCGKAADD